MTWRAVSPGLLLLVAACAPTAQDRLHELSSDGLSLYRMGAYAEARECFRSALKLHPNDPELVYNLARCHDRLGQPADAEKLYRQCTQVSPDHVESHHALVARLVATNRRDEGVTFVQGWLKARPSMAGPYVEDAWLRAGVGDLGSARARLQQALALEPRNPRALVEMARIYERQDRPDRALVLYERSLEAHPDQPEVRKHVEELLASKVGPPRPD